MSRPDPSESREQDGAPTKRRPYALWLVKYGIPIIFVGCSVGYLTAASSTPEPEVGHCLTGMNADFFGRMDIVDCSDPDARYEVVARSEAGEGGLGKNVCRHHPTGESHVATKGRTNALDWAVCAVPL